MNCLIQAASRAQSLFSLRLRRIPSEFHVQRNPWVFRFSRFVATLSDICIWHLFNQPSPQELFQVISKAKLSDSWVNSLHTGCPFCPNRQLDSADGKTHKIQRCKILHKWIKVEEVQQHSNSIDMRNKICLFWLGIIKISINKLFF